MSEPYVNLHDTMDAQVWAREWLRIIREHPEIPHEEEAMIGWFANAIMAGYDAGKRRAHLFEQADEEP